MPRKNQVTYEPEYEGKPIMTDKDKKLGCYKPILKRMLELFEDMIKRHNKVNVVCRELRSPEEMPLICDNKAIRAFHADEAKSLKRAGIDSGYISVREQKPGRKSHYHDFLLLDGSKIQNIEGHLKTAEEIWERKLGLPKVREEERDIPPECRKQGWGLIHNCTWDNNDDSQKHSLMLRRDDPEYATKIKQCFYRASYLAKENQKGNTPKGQRQLFVSRIKKK